MNISQLSSEAIQVKFDYNDISSGLPENLKWSHQVYMGTRKQRLGGLEMTTSIDTEYIQTLTWHTAPSCISFYLTYLYHMRKYTNVLKNHTVLKINTCLAVRKFIGSLQTYCLVLVPWTPWKKIKNKSIDNIFIARTTVESPGLNRHRYRAFSSNLLHFSKYIKVLKITKQ